MKKIFTVFAGRKECLGILMKYLKVALKKKIIDEVHLWNYTRIENDDIYLHEISNVKRTCSNENREYIEIRPKIDKNSFKIKVKALNDFHIEISDGLNSYEIVLGGWKNSRSVIRYECSEISMLDGNILEPSNEIDVLVHITCDNYIVIEKNGIIIMKCEIIPMFQIKKVLIKTGFGSVGLINYETTSNDGVFYFDTCEKKSWGNYYNHYENSEYQDDIIIKCDDDIVFIDLKALPDFIEYVSKCNKDIVFANIINNGLAAFYQQDKFNLLPLELGHFEYVNEGCGSLWESGEKASLLHRYFVKNYKEFIDFDYKKNVIPVKERFSINFIGIKGKNWSKICSNCGCNDEFKLTVSGGFKNVIYSGFYVSHLSFYKQFENFTDIDEIINQYDGLFELVYNSSV